MLVCPPKAGGGSEQGIGEAGEGIRDSELWRSMPFRSNEIVGKPAKYSTARRLHRKARDMCQVRWSATGIQDVKVGSYAAKSKQAGVQVHISCWDGGIASSCP